MRYYRGKPYEVDDLLKVAVYSAERVIVLGCSRQPRVADAQMLTTICALRCLPGARFLMMHAAEDESVPLARARDAAHWLLARAALARGRAADPLRRRPRPLRAVGQVAQALRRHN